MSESPQEFWASVDAQRSSRITCQECEYVHLVATEDAPLPRRCPWCGSLDIEAELMGAFANFTCPVHGRVTWITEEPLWLDDSEARLDVDLASPYCAPPESPAGEQEGDVTPEERIRWNAEEVIRSYNSEAGKTLGYDAESVAWVDGYLERERTRADVDEEALVTLFGSFLGECIIHHYGGRWNRDEDGWRVLIPSEGGGMKFLSPFARVERQLAEGADASLLRFFHLVARMGGASNRGEDSESGS